MTESQIQQLLKQERLPASFIKVVERVYFSLCSELDRVFQPSKAPAIIGINGCPGSGKSTMALFIKVIMECRFNRGVEILSIDDFYKTKTQRAQLAEEVHPLFITRGVPGTHDVELALNTISNLETAEPNNPCLIPRFDKAADDRHSIENWDTVNNAPAFIILEGWCVAATPQVEVELKTPINKLEREHDAIVQWRQTVNQHLSKSYAELFSLLQYLIVLHPPTPNVVLKWRVEQETKLRESILQDITDDDEGGMTQSGMSNEEVETFVMHYQRLIQHMHRSLPKKANALVKLDSKRTVTELVFT